MPPGCSVAPVALMKKARDRMDRGWDSNPHARGARVPDNDPRSARVTGQGDGDQIPSREDRRVYHFRHLDRRRNRRTSELTRLVLWQKKDNPRHPARRRVVGGDRTRVIEAKVRTALPRTATTNAGARNCTWTARFGDDNDRQSALADKWELTALACYCYTTPASPTASRPGLRRHAPYAHIPGDTRPRRPVRGDCLDVVNIGTRIGALHMDINRGRHAPPLSPRGRRWPGRPDEGQRVQPEPHPQAGGQSEIHDPHPPLAANSPAGRREKGDRSKGERPFAGELLDLLATRRDLAFPQLGRQLVGIAGAADGDHRLDVVVVGHAQRGPGLVAVEAHHAVDDQAHRRALQGPGSRRPPRRRRCAPGSGLPFRAKTLCESTTISTAARPHQAWLARHQEAEEGRPVRRVARA